MQAKLIIDDSLNNADLRYATGGFVAMDPFIFAEVRGARYLVATKLEYGRAQREALRCEIILEEDLVGDRVVMLPVVAAALLRRLGVTSCLVGETFPARAYKTLTSMGFIVKITRGWALFPEREIKRPDEIVAIKDVQRVIETGFDRIVSLLAASAIEGDHLLLKGEILTSEALRRAFDVECLMRDCVCTGTIVASGDQAVDPHEKGRGPVAPNSPIICDMFPRSTKTGYWSDMTRVVVKGKASPEVRCLHETVLEAHLRAFDMMRPGVETFKVYQSTCRFFASKGFKTGKINGVMQGFFHGFGHSLGLDIHELPRTSTKRGQVFQEGQVMTAEPGAYYLGLGGSRVEDTGIITANGFRSIARTPKKLLEIP